MSAVKYANLPDIDSAPDVYETEDTFPTRTGGESDDEEALNARTPSNGARAGKHIDGTREELDSSALDQDKASKKFRKAEQHHETRPRLVFAYPPSRSSSPTSSRSLSTRLRALQAELDTLEAELSDPANPLLHTDEDGKAKVDPGELMRGLVDVRGRLEKVKKSKDVRGKLVDSILHPALGEERQESEHAQLAKKDAKGDIHDMTEEETTALASLDRRVGELEELIGSSSISLDEMSPLPAPLLPMLTKLNTQLALLTQPRHLDSISRRLKLLISDLDRLSSVNAQSGANRRQTGHAPQTSASAVQVATSPLQEQLLPLLARLAPHLAHLPHLLTRLRTLSTLHTAAADFQGSLNTLEEEQRRARGRLDILSRAVEGVEKSLDDNARVVQANVGGLEERVNTLMTRLDALS